MKLSVVIPAYNEEATLEEIVAPEQALAVEKEVLIVDDGSTDGTGSLCNRLAEEESVRIFRHDRNQGKGAALRTPSSTCQATSLSSRMRTSSTIHGT